MSKLVSVRPQIATWWKANKYGIDISPIRVVAFTEKTVTYLEKWGNREEVETRSNLVSDYHHFFPSFEEARAWKVDRLTQKIEYNRQDIANLEIQLTKLRALEPPQ